MHVKCIPSDRSETQEIPVPKRVRLFLFALLLPTLLLATVLEVGAGEIRRLYPGLAYLARGNAGISYSQDEYALFYNPAGLGDAKEFIFVTPFVFEGSQTAFDIAQGKISTSGSTSAVAQNLLGKTIHLRIPYIFKPTTLLNMQLVYPFGKRYSGFTLAAVIGGDRTLRIGVSDAVNLNLTVADRLEQFTTIGLGMPIFKGQYNIGFSAMQIERCDKSSTSSVSGISSGFTSFVNNAVCTTGEMRKGTSFTLGFQQRMTSLQFLRMSWGMSILNAGGLKFARNSGETTPQDEKQEVNIGLAMQPNLGIARTLLLADLRDLTKNHADDTACKSAGGTTATNCWYKRLHLGLELGFLGDWIILRSGYNQGYPTSGWELSLPFLPVIRYADYKVETGTPSGVAEQRKAIEFSLEF
ncbi:MAG: hypothetical protein CL911_05120 [Deltaproteobacteria bacterium]|nr:hypothetical protein [Deltaproteobacteria bacterium]